MILNTTQDTRQPPPTTTTENDLAQIINSAEAEKPDGSSRNATDSFYHLFSNVSLRHRNAYLKQFKNSLSKEFSVYMIVAIISQFQFVPDS